MSAAIEHGPLVFFLIVITIGCLIASPMASKNFPSMGRTRRLMLGAFIVQIGGLLASVWTWMIHNQLAGAGSSGFCAAEGIVQCGSVIGDPYYSTDPIMGLPWGIIGLLAFSTLAYFTFAVYLDMEQDWAKKFAAVAYWLSIPGIFGVVWLVIVELFLVEGAPHICPYCTSVHIALIANIVILHIVHTEKDAGIWEALAPKQKLESPKKTKAKKEVSETKTEDAEKIKQEEIESEDENLELTDSGIKAKTKKSGGKTKSNRSKKRSKRRKR